MSYDLHAKKKDIPDLRMGAFSWPIILEKTGAGYVLEYGKGFTPASYVYTPRNGSPVSNDKFDVTITETKAMVLCCKGFVKVKRFVNKEWDAMSPEDRKQSEKLNEVMKVYTPYTGEQFLEKIEQFIEFAEKSGGFRIS